MTERKREEFKKDWDAAVKASDAETEEFVTQFDGCLHTTLRRVKTPGPDPLSLSLYKCSGCSITLQAHQIGIMK